MKEGSIKMDLIQSIKAREVLDSRGNPTVEVEVRSLVEQSYQVELLQEFMKQ